MGPLKSRHIPSGSRVLLDTVPFIYFLERHPQFHDPSKTLFQRIETGEVEAVASTLVFTELLVPIYRAQDHQRAQNVRSLLSTFPNLTFVSISSDLATLAARIRAEHKLRTPDAIHLATGLANNVSWVVTNDRAFAKLRGLNLSVWLFQ